jgi:hypothetical protein
LAGSKTVSVGYAVRLPHSFWVHELDTLGNDVPSRFDGEGVGLQDRKFDGDWESELDASKNRKLPVRVPSGPMSGPVWEDWVPFEKEHEEHDPPPHVHVFVLDDTQSQVERDVNVQSALVLISSAD